MRIFHLSGALKHIENSIRGMKRAKRLGYDADDIDILITKDNIIICCHWDRPLRRDGFIDPLRRIQVGAMVRELTWEQISGLRTRDGYRIVRVERALAVCARLNIIAYLEPKDDPRFAADAPWAYINSVRIKYGTKVRVRALPQNAAALPFAHRYFRTRRI